jgi:hypothetical protein
MNGFSAVSRLFLDIAYCSMSSACFVDKPCGMEGVSVAAYVLTGSVDFPGGGGMSC